MGMYLALYAVDEATIERLHADPPLAWRLVTPDRPEHEARARAERRPRPGLLARLFGRGADQVPVPPVPPLELQPGEGDLGSLGDFEKSWHGLHYLLTGSAWEGEPPLDFLLGGGRELEIESGDTPLRTHSPAETRAIAAALAGITPADFRARLQPEEMARLDIYPGGWEHEEMCEDLLRATDQLREALAEVTRRGFGLLVVIS